MVTDISERIKLNYYQGKGNFGDQLNLALWPRYLKNTGLGLKEDVVLYGIGTILNSSNVDPGRKIIFGAGAGYGEVPALTDEWVVYGVRGPKTAEVLGLQTAYAVTDPAILVADMAQKKADRSGVVFFPHESSVRDIPWARYCSMLGWTYISPRWSVDKTLDILCGSEFVIAEAMHGAIVADALRIPWMPVQLNGSILDFKWLDWCASMGLDYEPVRLGRLNLNTRGGRAAWPFAAPFMLGRLKWALKNPRWVLSSDAVFDRKRTMMKERLQEMKSDLDHGQFRHGYSTAETSNII